MNKRKWIQIALAASLLIMTSALVAQAATKTWVASNGSAGDGIAGVSGAGQAAVSIFIHGCTMATNFGSGISVNGAAASGVGSATARIGNSTIAHNVTGASAIGGGVLQSFKNNQIFANLTDGTPITAVPAPGGPVQ